MQSFTKPTTLDGAVLVAELASVGVIVTVEADGTAAPTVDGDGVLWLNIPESDRAAAEIVVANHTGTV